MIGSSYGKFEADKMLQKMEKLANSLTIFIAMESLQIKRTQLVLLIKSPKSKKQ